MLRVAFLASCLSLPAVPALSLDFATQYADAARAFTLPGTSNLRPGDMMEDDPVMALLPELEGNWIRVDSLYPDTSSVRPELMAELCERSPSALTRNAPRSFGMRQSRVIDGEPVSMTIHYDFMFGNSFDRSVREEELLSFMQLEASGEVPVGRLVMPQLRGSVLLFHPSPDILVLASPMGPPEFFARCS